MKNFFRKRGRNRRGVETVEVAVTLPLLMIVMFSSIEICHRVHVQKLLKIASYEAMKAGAAKEGSSADAIAVFNDHAKALGIKDAKLEIDANQFDRANTGDFLTLRASAPASSNRYPAPISVNISPNISGGNIQYRKEGL